MEELSMPAPIVVDLVPHSSNWAAAAEREMQRIAAALPGIVLKAHHIGSTAIPGIRAKPILDLMPVVRSLSDLDAAQVQVTALGYCWWGEYGIPGRRYCNFDDPATGRRLVQLHCFQFDHREIIKHLAFRNYLRAHSNIAREYELEKRRCRALHPENSHGYSDAKGPWIQNILSIALAEFARQNSAAAEQ